MKKLIYKANQYLLERYPIIWNTRIVWMLLGALVLHMLFFAAGFLTLSNPETLHEYAIKDVFFKNGAVYFTSMISILLLVGWLIYMFKNNAFKNFYPTSGLKLFGQFVCYILIIYSCSTFFLSYNYGIKSYIAISYPDNKVEKEIEIANDVAMFFSEKVNDYTIENRKYPKLFFDLYCETNDEFIDENLPYEEFLGTSYQFYTLRTREIPTKARNSHDAIEYANDSSQINPVYTEVNGDITTLYIKDSVVDIKPYINTVKPSYYNMSSTFFISRYDTLIDNYANSYNYKARRINKVNYNSNIPLFTSKDQLRNKRNFELLNRKDKTEIQTLLDTFLTFSNTYKVPHNLNAEAWANLVYHPDNFEVKHFIRTEKKNEFLTNTSFGSEYTKFEQFYKDRVTDYYYDNAALENVFYNIEDIKASSPFTDSIHFFIWFAFFFASIIFMFRTTGLKPLLFSVITVGVLTLVIALLGTFLSFILPTSGDFIGYTLAYFLIILGTVIFLTPILFADKIYKLIVAICINISIIGFPLYLILITGLITMHQDDFCRSQPDYYDSGYQCDTLFELLGINWSFVYFFATLLFLFFFIKAIKKWKSLPER
ncbi:hypothetical protein [Winogradskyella vidalii]|uniref:hypothetical protein n=1 Tax=Winogradskyella vidalii TaxID=2615024 RepID=UPI0015C9FDA2|nr:hypothetical protein [Winogradskyella vidalii]